LASDAHLGSGGSITELSVTDGCRDWGGDEEGVKTIHINVCPVPDFRIQSELFLLSVNLLKSLSDTVDAIPPALIEASEKLRHAAPDLFEKMLVHGVQVVGFGFAPTTATEFLEELMRTVERDMARA
jgi:hypothetical protein